MKARSLSRDVVAILLIAQIACALALSGVALLHERHARFHAFDVSLEGRSDSLLGAIQDAEDPQDNVYVDPAELKLPAEDMYAVYNEDGRMIGRSASLSGALVGMAGDGFRERSAGGTRYRVYERRALRIIDRGETVAAGLRRPVTIVYASPEEQIRRDIVEAAGYYVLTISMAALLTAGMVIVLVRKALRPIEDLSGAAAQLSAQSLVFSAPESVLRVTELRPLAAVLTRVVESLREAFAKEQRFVGDAAHELKTAVAVVRSTVQVLMLRPRSAEEYRAGLNRLLDDNSRVELLVTEMLTSASADGAPPEAWPAIDLRENVLSVMAQLGSVAEAHGVSLLCESAPSAESARVRLSGQHAAVLISNLILNAIQHSRAGMEVRCGIREEAGERVVLVVADTGSGIGVEALPHVFERFYREDRSRSRETGGAGLGLAICKAIVDASGGSIQIRSTPGEGTTVAVTFMEA